MEARHTERLLVGWAQRDITPHLPTVLYGQFHARIATEIHDPLLVTALALSDGSCGDCVVMVSTDRCSIPESIRERCRAAISERISDLPPEKVILNATHTHTAPWILAETFPPQAEGEMTACEYADLFVERVAEATAAAWQARKPGAVGWGMGHAVVGHNRRVSYFTPAERGTGPQPVARTCDGMTRMYGNTNDAGFSHIEGYEDHSVDMFFTWDENDELQGVVINLACPAQEVEAACYVSADFWHDVRVELRRRHGEHLFVMAQCSAAGDQSPHLLLHKRAEERMLALRGISRRQELGRRIANAVDDVLEQARREVHTRVPLRHRFVRIPLERWMVTEEEVATARAELAQLEKQQPGDAHEASSRHVCMRRCQRLIERFEDQKTHPHLIEEVHVVRLGDIAFATNRFELYLDYGERIKARSPALQTFVVQLAAGGAHKGSYLAPERSVGGGSFGVGAFCSEISPEGGRQLVEHTVQVLNELWAHG